MDIVGAVSSIVQLIDFSSQILARLRDYNARKSGPKVFSNIANQLPLLIADLERLKDEGDILPFLPEATREALSRSLEGCKAEIQTLQRLFDEVVPAANASRFQRAKKAVASMYREKEITATWNQVQSYRSALAHHFIPIVSPIAVETTISNDLCNIPPLHVPHFVNRPNIFGCIEETFRRPSPHTSRSIVTILLGMGGQGKTQLALEYCRHLKDAGSHKAIFWVEASSRDGTLRGMEAIAKQIAPSQIFNDQSRASAFVRETLSAWEEEWLIVFDNFDDPSEFNDLQTLFPQSRGGSILVTSRHHSSKYLGQTVQVDCMEEEEGLRLLLRSTETTDKELPLAKQILLTLGYLPLAIDQAHAYINKLQLPLDQFLEVYERRKRQILEEVPQLTVYRRKLSNSDQETALCAFTTWEMSLSLLGKGKGQDHAKRLAAVLTLFAFFHPFNISEKYFPDYLENPESSSSPMSVFFSHNGWDSFEFSSVIADMQALSLLRFSRRSSAEIVISLHPLVSEWLKMRLDPNQHLDFLSKALLHMKFFLEPHTDTKEPLGLEDREKVILHVGSLVLSCKMNEKDSQSGMLTFCDAYALFARYYEECGNFAAAEQLCCMALSGYERLLGPAHISILNVLLELGRINYRTGQFHEAEKVLNQALQRGRTVSGPDDPDDPSLEVLRWLGGVYFRLGRLKEAEETWNQVLREREVVSGADHTSTLSTLLGLGMVYQAQGNLTAAELMYDRVLAGRQKIFGMTHPLTLSTLSNLGELYLQQGRLDEASEMCDRSLAGLDRYSGKEYS